MERRKAIIIEFLIWLTLAILAWSLTHSFDDPLENYRYGAASWPRAIILAIGIFAFIEAILDFIVFRRHGPSKAVVIGGGRDNEPKKSISGGKVRLKRLATFAVPLLFLLMIPRMGYYVAAPFFIAGFMFLLGERRLMHLAVTSFMIYAVTLFVFTKLLFVPLPEGTWPGFYEISNWIIIVLQ